jgi:hypothetical protein
LIQLVVAITGPCDDDGSEREAEPTFEAGWLVPEPCLVHAENRERERIREDEGNIGDLVCSTLHRDNGSCAAGLTPHALPSPR